jgi:hypothetical protein
LPHARLEGGQNQLCDKIVSPLIRRNLPAIAESYFFATRSGSRHSKTCGVTQKNCPLEPALFISEEQAAEVREEKRQAERDADSEAQEDGESYEFVEIGSAATFCGLTSELEIQERLDAAINRCLKQLLMVRGVKSVAAEPPSASPKRIIGPTKAA